VKSSSFSLASSSPLGKGDCESSSSPLGLACDMSCLICELDVLCRFAQCVSSAIVSLRVDSTYLEGGRTFY
jgi:hypothetical protein